MTTERMATRCGVTGPVEIWRSIGYEVTTDGVTWSVSERYDGRDALVYEGRRVTGRDDWHALAWAAAEEQRRHEACTASTAQAREADALRELAASIRSAGDETVLGRVLSRLSERTQYAVRQQLRGSGVAGM
jgi:hypothetical protein